MQHVAQYPTCNYMTAQWGQELGGTGSEQICKAVKQRLDQKLTEDLHLCSFEKEVKTSSTKMVHSINGAACTVHPQV